MGGIGEIIMGGLGLIGSLIGGSKGASTPAQPASPGTEAVDPKEAATAWRKEQAAKNRNATDTVGTGLGSGMNDSDNRLANTLGGV